MSDINQLVIYELFGLFKAPHEDHHNAAVAVAAHNLQTYMTTHDHNLLSGLNYKSKHGMHVAKHLVSVRKKHAGEVHVTEIPTGHVLGARTENDGKITHMYVYDIHHSNTGKLKPVELFNHQKHKTV